MGQPVAPPPTGPIYTDVQCELEALPKRGSVAGTAKGSDGSTIAGAKVQLTDSDGKVRTATSGPGGTFKFADLPLGEAKIQADADDYMMHVTQTTIRPREATNVIVTLNKRPKRRNVRIVGKQLQVLKKIHFETNSARIKGDSNTILEEIADVMHRNPKLRKVEIQGHTDNTGTRATNERLSQDRADSVRKWLAGHGIAASRLAAKGYGSSRPLAPNVTPANRARNRRVQFIILEKN